jgi:beta-glucosidase
MVVSEGDLVEVVVTLGNAGHGGSAFGSGIAMLGLIARRAPRDQGEVIAEAVHAARAADVAVVVVGLTEEQETEAVDKHTLVLPGRQDELVRAVASEARKTVVVVNAATPAVMPWADEVDAVLWAGLPGQEGGHAVAAALLGTIEPAGRLVTTFPVEDGAAPAWSVTPIEGAVTYEEGSAIGYRGHYAGRASAPAFWFGHGLGYSTWQYSDARLLANNTGPAVEVTVTNTGDRISREVVQVYFDPIDNDQPIRLVGWSAVELAPAASASVVVACDRRLWRRWDTASGAWEQLPDDGLLIVARGLGDGRETVALSP